MRMELPVSPVPATGESTTMATSRVAPSWATRSSATTFAPASIPAICTVAVDVERAGAMMARVVPAHSRSQSLTSSPMPCSKDAARLLACSIASAFF